MIYWGGHVQFNWKRMKSGLEDITLSNVSWGTKQEAAFKSLQEALKMAVKLDLVK